MDAFATARLLRLIGLTLMGALFVLIHLEITWRVLRSALLPRYLRLLGLFPLAPPFLIGRAGYPRMAKSWLAAGITYAILWLVPSLFEA